MWRTITDFIVGSVMGLFLLTSKPEIFVAQVPKSAPVTETQVFTFSVRDSKKHLQDDDAIEAIPTPALVSDPSQWQVSMQELGTSIYKSKNAVVLEHQGKIVATFETSRYGFQNTKIKIKLAAPSEITCWGGGRGNPKNDHAMVQVGNRFFATAGGYFNKIGLSIFVVNRFESEKIEAGDPLLFGAKLPIFWTRINKNTYEYFLGGTDVDIYLSYSEANSPRSYLKFLWGITGLPKMPPVYALGFMASRWGWESREYISNVLDRFDNQAIPIDAFIMDFEWYLNITGGDYLIPPDGLPDYPDFRFGNKKTFPDIYGQANEYRGRSVKFGGIRKPRLGDMNLIAQARSNEWVLLRHSQKTHDLNFGLDAVRQWYAEKTRSMVTSASSMPDFFWNDEGETSYFTYHHWIEAQQLAATEPGKRRFSLNRAYTPGMQRLEAAAVWTGDVPTTWESLRENVDMLTRWSEAGVPLVTFDIGGFAGAQDKAYAELLVRWYQVGIFAGVMRVHSTLNNTPHFPFADLWGQEAASAMQDAIRLRYMLIPTLMAAAYKMKTQAMPWIERKEPGTTHASTDFLCADGTIFVAPVLEPMMNKTNVTVKVSFPVGSRWYPLTRKSPLVESSEISVTSIPLNQVLVYGKEGSMILMHGGTIEYLTRATELINGDHTLRVLIFASTDPANAEISSTLVEDDGQTENSPVRITSFTYNHQTRNLAWKFEGNGPKWYTAVHAILRLPDGEEFEAMRNLESHELSSLSLSM